MSESISFNVPFHTETHTTEWTSFLGYLQEKVLDNPYIYPYPIAYRDDRQKTSYLQAFAKGTTDYNDYKNCRTVTSAARDYKSGPGTIFIFIVNMDPAAPRQPKQPKQQKKHPRSKRVQIKTAENISSWHTMVVHLKGGEMEIYDPNFKHKVNKTQISTQTNMSTIRAFISALKKLNKKLDCVYVGGGGNTGLRCNEMCRQWLEDQIIGHRGGNIGNWKEYRGWVKYKKN
jgi:hypothetical protein